MAKHFGLEDDGPYINISESQLYSYPMEVKHIRLSVRLGPLEKVLQSCEEYYVFACRERCIVTPLFYHSLFQAVR